MRQKKCWSWISFHRILQCRDTKRSVTQQGTAQTLHDIYYEAVSLSSAVFLSALIFRTELRTLLMSFQGVGISEKYMPCREVNGFVHIRKKQILLWLKYAYCMYFIEIFTVYHTTSTYNVLCIQYINLGHSWIRRLARI